MATPSSSATSPSPALSFAVPATVSDHSTEDPTERAERDEHRAKFLKRVEFSKITRALRSTLALASYKAKHNLMTVPLRSLEAQVAHIKPQPLYGFSSADPLNASSSNDKKRKASGSANGSYYGTGAGHGLATPSYGSSQGYNNMAGPSIPPASAHQHTNATHSLFASILAPPPSKRARTIHNPEAPPVPPAKPYTPSSQVQGSSSRGKKKGKTVSKATKAEPKSSKSHSKPSGSRKRAGSHDSARTTRSAFSGEDVNDKDIKAAATLTEIFFSHGAGSPRSSFASAATIPNGSQEHSLPNSQSRTMGGVSHSQRSSMSSLNVASPTLAQAPAQSSQGHAHSRTQSSASIGSNASGTVTGRRPGAGIDVGRQDVTMEDATRRSATPTAARPGDGGKARASDSEAADLMLLLANSPSPRRPTVARDKEVVRNVYAAGRVLFPTASQSSTSSGQSEDHSHGDAASREGKMLARSLGSAGSFSSVFGSERTLVGGEGEQMKGRGGEDKLSRETTPKALSPVPTQISILPPADPVVTPPTPTGPTLANVESRRQETSPSSLLPAPPFPSKPTNGGSFTPSQSFKLSDYINVSPSPSSLNNNANPSSSVPSQPGQPGAAGARQKSSLSAPSASATSMRHQAVISSPLRKSFDSSGVGMPTSSSAGFGGIARRLFEGEVSSGVVDGTGVGAVEGGATIPSTGVGVRHPTPLESGINLHS